MQMQNKMSGPFFKKNMAYVNCGDILEIESAKKMLSEAIIIKVIKLEKNQCCLNLAILNLGENAFLVKDMLC